MLRDEVGRGWVLIGLGSSDGLGGVKGARRRGVSKGSVLSVKMGWDVDLDLSGADMQGKEEEEDAGENRRDAAWKVAVLWDVLDA